MKRLKTLALVLGVALTASQGWTQDKPAAADAPAPAPDKGGAPASEAGPTTDDRVFGWFTSTMQDGRLQMSYGEPETDNIAITFVCRPGESAVHATGLGLEGEGETNHPEGSHWTTRFSMLSGEATGEYSGQAVINGENGPMMEDAPIALTDPVLLAFGQTGQLSVEHNPLPAETDADRALVRTFLAACGGSAAGGAPSADRPQPGGKTSSVG
jgi:hypothetical protein